MRLSTLFIAALPLCVSAQTPLPYTTGFDNATQQAGWQQFRTGHLSTYSWSMPSFGSPSAPNHLWHDYPVGGSDTDTVRDWWVSPPFDFSLGAHLTLKVNVYAIMGSSMPSDGLKIMLLTGSANPALATIVELEDLLPLVTTGSTYTQLPTVDIPPTAGSSRIAFFYQATQNWLTPGIDDVSITAVGVGIEEASATAVRVEVSPNPAVGVFTISASGAGTENPGLLLCLFNAQGAMVHSQGFRNAAPIDAPLSRGAYVYTLSDDRGRELARGRIVRE